MPPKRQIGGGAAVGRPQPQGYARTALNELTSAENRTVVTAVAFFVTGVAFLHSSWSEVLLPP